MQHKKLYNNNNNNKMHYYIINYIIIYSIILHSNRMHRIYFSITLNDNIIEGCLKWDKNCILQFRKINIRYLYSLQQDLS